MSIYKSPEPPRGRFLKSLIHYLCYEFKSGLDLEEYLDVMYVEEVENNLRIGAKFLKMYGTTKDLAENVRIFRDFSMNHSIWGGPKDLFNTTPIVYDSLKNETYITKMDACILLQNAALLVISSPPISFDPNFKTLKKTVQEVISPAMARVDKRIEFVKFNVDFFDKLILKLCDATQIKFNKTLIKAIARTLSNEGYKEILELFQFFSPSWKKPKYNDLSILEEFHPNMETKNRAKAFRLLYYSVVVQDFLETTIDTHPDMFLPNSDSESEKLITVRLFEDGDQRFVMVEELIDALNKNSDVKLEYRGQESIMKTMSMKDVLRMFGDQVEHFEFILTPILRSKHKAVPVPCHNNTTSYVLVADALLEFLRNLIFGQRVFQTSQTYASFSIYDVMFEKMELNFKPDYNDIYFVKTDWNDELMKAVLNSSLFLMIKPRREVRDVKSSGFTSQELKDELIYLKLVANFRDITDYAEIVWKEVDRVKKEEFLRTCDMFDAVEMCQLICIFNRWPNLKNVIHNQKACSRIVGMECDRCGMNEQNSKIPELHNFDIYEEDKWKWTTDFPQILIFYCVVGFFVVISLRYFFPK